MNETRWWKCDLQVATPAWNFRFPQGSAYDVQRPEGRQQFLDEYMGALRAAGVDVIALADHNTGEWIDDAKAAGTKHGVVVFPGCEITTHTGSDGVHLVIIGDLDKTSRDFDRLIHGSLGFNADHPPFRTSGGNQVPGTSSKTLTQLLDELPDGYLAIAPHSLTDNGIASRNTVRGDMRWKAIHHERLVALDPGDCSTVTGTGFNDQFRRRELRDFPRLAELAFVSTSDAYAISDLGRRFTWLRMGQVSLEGLRQAFLDHESRVLCDWSLKLNDFPDRNPNNIRHAWIKNVTLGGLLGNSTAPLSIPFHPNLNVIIGGRGSGKSSVVAALRQIYVGTETLPKRLKEESETFVDTVFASAELKASHRVQESQAKQEATWTKIQGRLTTTDEKPVPTSFPVTVISQKELFERAAGDKNDPCMSSRCLFGLVDGSIGYNAGDTKSVTSFGRKLEDARVEWAHATRNLLLLRGDLMQLPALRQQVATLQGQVDAFSSAEVKQRLARITARRSENQSLEKIRTRIRDLLGEIGRAAVDLSTLESDPIDAAEPFRDDYIRVIGRFEAVAERIAQDLKTVEQGGYERLSAVEAELEQSPWHQDGLAASCDLEAYTAELDAKGLSTTEFSRLQADLERTRSQVAKLEEQESKVAIAQQRADVAWQAIMTLVTDRRGAREHLLKSVEVRSGRLRFKSKKLEDISPWVDGLRSTAGFRADAFLEDVPALAGWLWIGPSESISERWLMWRNAISAGDLSALQPAGQLRPTFAQKLAGLDEAIRLRLATLVPDDVVEMEFLREGANSESVDGWQSVTQGSPGQRTAAMLAFVLHHGHEPLVLDQPEDDLDSEWISKLVVKELRKSRWHRQLIVVSHNANIPVLGDAEQVIALENRGGQLCLRASNVIGTDGTATPIPHVGPVESFYVRNDIQSIMEGGIAAFVRREQKYNNETRAHRLMV